MARAPRHDGTASEERKSGAPGSSPLLTEIGEQLQIERERLERQAGWRAVARAEREIAEELGAEARRRLREVVERRAKEAGAPEAALEGDHLRFSLLFRVQHIGLVISTLVLIITGLPLRYAETAWAQAFFRWIGGVPVQAATHRGAAGLLIAVSVFHMGYIIFSKEGRGQLSALIPGLKDFADLFRNLAYFVGFRRVGPRFDRFSYVEKFDYWAVYWGIVVMVGSGLLLWSHAFAMRHLPKYVLDIATLIHSDEALLAATAIIIWHFYNAHLNPDVFPMNRAWLTGRISMEHMREHHPVEYETIYGASRSSPEEQREA